MTISDIIIFDVHGEPKPRARFKASKTGHVYDIGTADGWRERFWLQAKENVPTEPWTGPIGIDLIFYFSRPQRLQRKKDRNCLIACDKVADNDNLEKAVWDEMQNMGFFVNDKQICDNRTRKFYVARKGFGRRAPGCMVNLWKVST